MIGILKFKLPEEQCEFEAAQRGDLYRWKLQELDNWLKNSIDNLDSKKYAREIITYQEIRFQINERCEGNLYD